MIDGKNFFDQPVKNNKITNENIRKITTGREDDYTTGCLLGYAYFRDIKAIQQINFTANLDRPGNTGTFFIFEEAKETAFDFSQGIVKVL